MFYVYNNSYYVYAQVDRQYVVCVGVSGILLVMDQHAAHERVRYEGSVLICVSL